MMAIRHELLTLPSRLIEQSLNAREAFDNLDEDEELDLDLEVDSSVEFSELLGLVKFSESNIGNSRNLVLLLLILDAIDCLQTWPAGIWTGLDMSAEDFSRSQV